MSRRAPPRPALLGSSVCSSQTDQDGFTLIEVVCVMAILGLLLAVVLPAVPHAVSRPQIEGLALAIAAVLNADHRSAMHRHAEVASLIDVKGRLVGSGAGERSVSLPNGVGITAILAASCGGRPVRDRIVFLPDSTACGGTIVLDRSGQRIEVRVNWLTGATELGSVGR